MLSGYKKLVFARSHYFLHLELAPHLYKKRFYNEKTRAVAQLLIQHNCLKPKAKLWSSFLTMLQTHHKQNTKPDCFQTPTETNRKLTGHKQSQGSEQQHSGDPFHDTILKIWVCLQTDTQQRISVPKKLQTSFVSSWLFDILFFSCLKFSIIINYCFIKAGPSSAFIHSLTIYRKSCHALPTQEQVY